MVSVESKLIRQGVWAISGPIIDSTPEIAHCLPDRFETKKTSLSSVALVIVRAHATCAIVEYVIDDDEETTELKECWDETRCENEISSMIRELS